MRWLLLIIFIFAMMSLPVIGIIQARSETRPMLVYVRYEVAMKNLNVYRVHAKELSPLTDHPAADMQPALSPNHKWVAFISNRDGNYEIYRMRSDGTQLKRLTYNAGIDQEPVWLDNGREIQFISMRNGNAYLYQINVNGRGLQKIASLREKARSEVGVNRQMSLLIPEMPWRGLEILLIPATLLLISGYAAARLYKNQAPQDK